MVAWRWQTLSATRSRVGAALLAALVTSTPFLLIGIVFPVIGLMTAADGGRAGFVFFLLFGILLWLTLFLPALAGIILVQYPLKRLGERRGWSEGAQLLTVLSGNASVTLALGRWLFGPPGMAGSVFLLLAAAMGSAIWLFFDMRVWTVAAPSNLPEELPHG